jgi:hypothetical protein
MRAPTAGALLAYAGPLDGPGFGSFGITLDGHRLLGITVNLSRDMGPTEGYNNRNYSLEKVP